MLFSLLALAGLTTAFNDVTYADLAYARPATEAPCEARFDNGAIEITQAFNSANRTLVNVAVLTGQTETSLPAGTQLWVKSPFGPAWRALVLDGEGQRIRVVAHHRFVGDLLTSDWLSVSLYRSLDGADPIPFTVATDANGFRGKLADALDCADDLGI